VVTRLGRGWFSAHFYAPQPKAKNLINLNGFWAELQKTFLIGNGFLPIISHGAMGNHGKFFLKSLPPFFHFNGHSLIIPNALGFHYLLDTLLLLFFCSGPCIFYFFTSFLPHFLVFRF
jgi:hypothetical protein